MTKRSPSQWQALFSAHQQSGLSQAAFCKQQGLSTKYFSLRRKQLTGDRKHPVSATDFVRVQKPSEVSSVASLHYQGMTLRFVSVDATMIASVMKQLAC